MFNTILYEIKDSVAWITLNRPEKLNSFNEAMHTELQEALQSAENDKNIRAIVLTGAGRAFSAGQDLSEVDNSTDYGGLLRSRYNPIIQKMSEIGKPIIAAVNGTAAGAGFSLALAADFRLVSEKASFLNAFVHIGLVPDSGNTYYLPRIVGHAKALELMVLGEKVSAAEAERLGLATKVITVEDWESDVSAFAGRLASMPTKAIGLMKEGVIRSWNSTLENVLEGEAHAQSLAGLSTDHQEGVQAFLEKRQPLFTGD
ncbi:2-(1,2-epoxy-1,2-dihydrophenyl)acetyl-CoA isomerase [Siminovitchia terrae]|uniref:2-(1,2-epoxy-1,2-dihydrophenyl)acetyl-CoA isomerase n=1 Tax=Siminovitchia terrae TaxID=1914933 RepID=A0A429X6V5_SIMTE|nr:enoyl-CoA hydratase-related protein [Siminovitchia terrae]RST59168.1 2-(1,2-epoxy-1,2-dihydrophenyl)acetyl-CoA isomerase [Siminovitchia terrae]